MRSAPNSRSNGSMINPGILKVGGVGGWGLKMTHPRDLRAWGPLALHPTLVVLLVPAALSFFDGGT